MVICEAELVCKHFEYGIRTESFGRRVSVLVSAVVAHGGEVVGSRLNGIATVWMVGHRHGRVQTRVAWLALAADACEWYAGLVVSEKKD